MRLFWKKYVKIASASGDPSPNRRLPPVAGRSTSRSYRPNKLRTIFARRLRPAAYSVWLRQWRINGV